MASQGRALGAAHLRGLKILVSDLVKIPVAVSLGVIVAILAVTIAASFWKTREQRPDDGQILRQSGLATVDATAGAPGGPIDTPQAHG